MKLIILSLLLLSSVESIATTLPVNLPYYGSGSCAAGEQQVMATNGTGCIPVNNPATKHIGDTVPEVTINVTASQVKHLPAGNSTGYTPAGWTAGNGGNPVPPATARVTSLWPDNVAPIGNYGDTNSACSAYCGKSGYPSCGGVNVLSATQVQFSCKNASNQIYSNLTTSNRQDTCPAGYTLSGSTCNLTTAANVVKPSDGHCNIVRTGNTFSDDPKDPDCTTQASSGASASSSTMAWSVPPLVKTTTTNNTTTGETTVVQSIGDTASGTTTTTTVVMNGATGAVTGVASTTTNGVGSATTTTPSSSNVTFDKSGLATESGQAATNSKLDQLHTDLSTSPTADNTASSFKSDLNTKNDDYKTALQNQGNNPLNDRGVFTGNWLPNLPSTTCSVIDFGISGHTAQLDVCAIANKVKNILAWITYFLTSLALFNIAFPKKVE